MSIHLVPAIQIGVNVLNGAVIDAQVWAVDKYKICRKPLETPGVCANGSLCGDICQCVCLGESSELGCYTMRGNESYIAPRHPKLVTMHVRQIHVNA